MCSRVLSYCLSVLFTLTPRGGFIFRRFQGRRCRFHYLMVSYMRLSGALALSIFFAGCGRNETEHQIQEIRIVERPSIPIKANVTSVERFSNPMANNAEVSSDADSVNNPFQWKVPDGWNELPPTRMRLINLGLGGHAEAECYVAILSGPGGGVLANVNRWRKQMALPPLRSEDLTDLPKKSLFGRPATHVDLQGTYGGMQGNFNKPEFRLVGLILEHQGISVFVKMIGPQNVVAEELANFFEFSLSLTFAEAPQKKDQPASSSESFDQRNLTWSAPSGWRKAQDNPIRLVTYLTSSSEYPECYITVLPGNVGGVVANINRWQKQMGQMDLSEMEIANLPSITILGKEAKLVEIHGNYTGMKGATNANFIMLASISELLDHTVFIKMIGPAAVVDQQRNDFIQFCESLIFSQ